jgi:hypothetical protein
LRSSERSKRCEIEKELEMIEELNRLQSDVVGFLVKNAKYATLIVSNKIYSLDRDSNQMIVLKEYLQ